MNSTKKPCEKVDYSHEIKLVSNPILRGILVFISFISLVLAVLGIFLPILPTTPFLILSAFLYAKSSSKFYNWIMNHRLFGPSLRDWKNHRSVSKKSKILAIAMILATFSISIVFVVPIIAIKILLGVIGITILVFIIRLPEKKSISTRRVN